MSKLYLHNTLTKKKELFEPLKDDVVRIYECGPTVYDVQHIGNLRAFVLWDILRRTLEYAGYDVKQIINITDVGHLVSDADSGEDKMSKGLRKEGMEVTLENMLTLGRKFEEIFKTDLKKLNIKKPHKFPRASEHIEEDIELVRALEEGGFTYEISDGIYFDTSKDPDYGKIAGGIDRKDADEEFARLETGEKKNVRDFALWKFDDERGWDSPWGQGFPGWHIECSVMSEKYLGVPFDIHTGGIEHIPVHHTNEIAQTENARENGMARFWLHNNHLQIDGTKISKSLGNVVNLSDIEEKGFSPLALRYFYLGAHYSSEQNFTWEALEDSARSLRKLRERARQIRNPNIEIRNNIHERYQKQFKEHLFDDLNTPQALAVVWEMLKDDSVTDDEKYATLMGFDRVLGLKLDALEEVNIPEDVQKLVEAREKARQSNNFEKADKLRKEIEAKGFEVRDTDEGSEVTEKS